MKSFFSFRVGLVGLIFLLGTVWGVAQVGDTVRYSLADTLEAKNLFEEAVSLRKENDLKQAFQKFLASKNIYSSILGENSIEVAKAQYYIAVIYMTERNYNSAIEYFEYSKRIFDKYGCQYSGHIVSCCNNLGNILNEQARLDKAIEWLSQGLEVVENCENGDKELFPSLCTNLGISYDRKGVYSMAYEYHLRSLNLYKKTYGENSPNLIQSLNNIGVNRINVGEFDEANEYLHKALSIVSDSFNMNHPSTIQSYYNLGLSYQKRGMNDKAMEYFLLSLLYNMKQEQPNLFGLGLVNMTIGSIYDDLGDFDKAIEHYEESLNLLIGIVGNEHPYIAGVYSNIGSALHSLREVNEAIEYHNRALAIQKTKLGENHIDVASAYNNLALCYHVKHDFEKAIEYLELSLKIKFDRLGENHLSTINTLNNLGKNYLAIHDYEKARSALEDALNNCRDLVGEQHVLTSMICYNLGLYYDAISDYDKSKVVLGNALKSINYVNEDSIKKVLDPNELIYILNYLGYLHRKYYEQDKATLLKSKDSYSAAIKVIIYLSENLKSKTKSNLSIISQESFIGSLATNYLLHSLTDSLHYLTEGFDFAERSKAMLLYEAMQETNALSVSGIPDSLLQLEYDLRIDIAYYDKKRQEKLSEGATDTDSTVLAIGSKLFDLNRRYEALKSRFETDYPQYYKAKYDLSTISLAEVQKDLLQPDQSLLEYLVGDSNIYVYLVRKDTFFVREIKHDFPLDKLVQEMTKDGIYGYHTLAQTDTLRTTERNKACISSYTNAAHELYEKLVAPVAGQLTEEVIVVPDGVLGYVPFEALLTQKPAREGAFSSYSYLLRERQISYCYSATLLREMKQKQHRQPPAEPLLAMAPFYRDDVQELISKIDTTELLSLRDSLDWLDGSGQEVAAAVKLLNGSGWYGGQASLEKFRQEAGRYRILHLSTHGKADDRQGDYAYLAFGVPGDTTAFDKLYARDLYNYSLNADLVVLSACETGIGKLRKGEGIVSLARAFAYAGAKSIFTTLWQVNDAKTAELMRFFYKNLRKGLDKDAALRQAKLDYLRRNKGEYNHPFYWAAMIGIGDMRPIQR